MTVQTAEEQGRGESVNALLRPRSVAIVGISSKPGSLAERTLRNLVRFGFSGELFGVSRGQSDIDGVPCVPSIDDLPPGIELAVLSVPRDAVEPSVLACARHGMKAVIVFTAGFAEEGPEGRGLQERIAAIAAENGMALLGPNCLGLINYIDGVPLCFGPLQPEPPNGRRTVAIISQSGGMMAHTMVSLHARGLAVGYAISTGNEASLSVVDFVCEVASDPAIDVLCVFAEHIQRPRDFIEALRVAETHGKSVVLLHAGRGEASQLSALSHTGALAGDYDVMSAALRYENVFHVQTLEEFVDVAELLTRNAALPTGKLAILTDSGASKGLMLDYCESVDLDLASFSSETEDRIRELLPPFATISNPLDMTAVLLRDEGLLGGLSEAVLADQSVGALLISLMPDPVGFPLGKAEKAAEAIRESGKVAAYAVIGGEAALNDGLQGTVQAASTAFTRSPERAVRALSFLLKSGEYRTGSREAPSIEGDALAVSGMTTEWALKDTLRGAGFAVPDGGLVTTLKEATDMAALVGYPVVLKVQSVDIPHKTEVGGVRVGISDAATLKREWNSLTQAISEKCPDARIDGCLLEKMAAPGVEFIIGAKRDPEWGVMLMVGLGGIWLEIMRDRRLFPSYLDREAIERELRRLTAAPLLDGARGQAPLDVASIVDAVMALARLAEANPQVREIEINPIVVYPHGKQAVVLDALAIT